jgi:hypothetical protein
MYKKEGERERERERKETRNRGCYQFYKHSFGKHHTHKQINKNEPRFYFLY